MILSVYIDADTERRLRACAERLQRSMEDLAEAAVAEAALGATRHISEDREEGRPCHNPGFHP